jgi:uncharacterized protein YkwD
VKRLGYQARLYLSLGFGVLLLIGVAIGFFLSESSLVPAHITPPKSTTKAAVSPPTSPTTAKLPSSTAGGKLRHLSELEDIILEEANVRRQRAGLRPLRSEETLRRIARQHSDDMLARDFFAHINPDGKTVGDRIASGHRRLIGTSGENIWRGVGFRTDSEEQKQKVARGIMADWMSSQGHRENILRPEFSHLGVGVSVDSGVLLATQNFSQVQAYTQTAIPSEVRRGESLDLRTSIIEAADDAERYDLWSPRGEQEAGHFPIGVSEINVQPGGYILRFYFTTDQRGSYDVFRGPGILVK